MVGCKDTDTVNQRDGGSAMWLQTFGQSISQKTDHMFVKMVEKGQNDDGIVYVYFQQIF